MGSDTQQKAPSQAQTRIHVRPLNLYAIRPRVKIFSSELEKVCVGSKLKYTRKHKVQQSCSKNNERWKIKKKKCFK